MRFRTRSLRTQLVLLGLGAVLIPLLLLFTAVLLTTSGEEIVGSSTDDEVDLTGNIDATGIEATNDSSVPGEVIVTALLVAVAGSVAIWLWAGRAVRPMATITDVANEIQSGSLDRRLGLEGAAAEVQALGDSFDDMLDRLATASATEQRLIEDASHELRTPLAALAVNNELILERRDPTLDDFRANAERSEALIARLQLTIDELLLDARARHRSTRQVDNDLMAIVARVVDQHRALNPSVPVSVGGPAELRLGIDGPSVERALVNLFENAVRFSPPAAPIEIEVVAGPPARLSVTDHGPGIPPADLDRIFDRYYRSDSAAGEGAADGAVSGAGIGLALVKQVADAHGHIAVTSPVDDDGGTRFTLTFTAST